MYAYYALSIPLKTTFSQEPDEASKLSEHCNKLMQEAEE